MYIYKRVINNPENEYVWIKNLTQQKNSTKEMLKLSL